MTQEEIDNQLEIIEELSSSVSDIARRKGAGDGDFVVASIRNYRLSSVPSLEVFIGSEAECEFVISNKFESGLACSLWVMDSGKLSPRSFVCHVLN